MNCGIPTREDDGHQVALSVTATVWDPYARGRRNPSARATPDLGVGSLPARTTGPRPVSDPGCSSGAPTRADDGQMPDRNNPPISALPERKDDGLNVPPKQEGRRIRHHPQTRPYETRPCLSWKQPHPRKAGPHSCSISETASANTACSTASPKRASPKRRACTPTPSKNSSRAAPRAWTPSTASPASSTQPPTAS